MHVLNVIERKKNPGLNANFEAIDSSKGDIDITFLIEKISKLTINLYRYFKICPSF